jgi:NAD-dependent dihydropyrimidine dehydrogenase PreA subunit
VTSILEAFCQAFGVWDEAQPYLGLMVDEEEMRLVLALGQESCAAAEVDGRLLALDAQAQVGLEPGAAAALLEKAYGRHVVDRERHEGRLLYKASRFDRLLDHVAKHGRWNEVPEEVRRALDRHFLTEFVEQQRPAVEAMMHARRHSIPERSGVDGDPDPEVEGRRPPNDAVLLLHEVEEMIDAATHIALEPCDCRRLGEHCGRPVDTCLWMDDLALEALERGHSTPERSGVCGRRLSREEAREVVRRADKAGLMHTGDPQWRTRGLGAICNCCACDCYPFRAAQILGSKGTWPRSRYVARYDPGACNLCRACVKRCHFGAFSHDGELVVAFASRKAEPGGKEKRPVAYDPALCWGCGLCANTCPSGAITMEPLP